MTPRAGITVTLTITEHEALVQDLHERGHVSEPDVTCRVCRALHALENPDTILDGTGR